MEITGWDSVVFTTASPRDVFVRVLAAILARWPRALVDAGEGDIDAVPISEFPIDRLPEERGQLIFFRDAEMVRHTEREAYASMADGDGPFMLISRIRKDVEFEIVGLGESNAADHRSSAARPPDPYPAWICSPWIIEITVVTPGDPSAAGFSSWVLSEVKHCCSM